MANDSLLLLAGLLTEIGQAGKRLSEIDASEGAAGNLSVCVRSPLEINPFFPILEKVELHPSVPELAGATLIVTGSGRRLREIADDPTANLACLLVDVGGRTASQHTSRRREFRRVTSEFNTHLAVHRDRLKNGGDVHAIVHAQPLHLTYLSHVARYQEARYLNTHLFRWQPETIYNLPEGIGVLPFIMPASDELMNRTVDAMRVHQLVVWSKHGIVARSGSSILHAVDLVEYAETAASYEYLNLANGEAGTGLSVEEILAICENYGIQQRIFG